jgi:hypothetical protein
MATRTSLRGLAVAGLFALSSCGGGAPTGTLSFSWPPKCGERYPDLELLDHRGAPVRLSTYAGKLLLIEPIGMT